ncbi:MAG TPA: MFS transporter [Solirubrobacteraceae bacterium]|jgi:EmrB/QacA subfamily drug resistance transporter|nr:MFS transporter [Solirubrobacteraceae bacterium]
MQKSETNRWLVLVIVCLAQFMVVLDATVVNIALPSIQHGLDFSDADLQWVVNAYTLVFGGFLLLGGRAADLLGRKRLFLAGVVLFTAASLLNGLAQSSSMLIAGRALQGLGGALVSPAALSILMTSFPGTQERTKALGVWSAIVAGGAAAGLLLGGVLTDLLSWEWVFFVNVPVGILAVVAALRFVPESRDEKAHRAFDLAGAVTVTGGLIVLVYAIVKAQSFGWGSTRTVAMLAAAGVLLVAFVAIERRSAAPLIRLNIFRTRTLTAANASMMLVASGMMSMFFFASLYVQELMGYSPLRAGLAFLPVTSGIMIGAGIAQVAIRRFGPRPVPVVGLLLATFGMVWLTALPVDGSYVSDLLAGLFPMSLGMGLTFVPVTLLATAGVPAEDSGLASGLLNTSQQVGGALGLAILSTLAANHTTSLLASGTARPLALLNGWHVAFTGGAVVLALAALTLVVLLRRRHLAQVDVDAAVPVAA